jgi:hypothetical protein
LYTEFCVFGINAYPPSPQYPFDRPIPHHHLRSEEKEKRVQYILDERLPARTVEREEQKQDNDRDPDDEYDRALQKHEQHEQQCTHADHPEKLPPGQRTRDLVLDIDELWCIEHHSTETKY